jgi:Ni/Co efflux regulator RcnB
MKKLIALAVMVACGLTPLAQAHDHHGPDDRGPQQHQGTRDDHRDHRDHGGPDHRGPQGDRRHDSGPDRHQMHERDHFAWRGHDFRKGHPMPHGFHDDGYRVSDWRGRGLPAPPSGHHWSYIDGNYVLIAAATGVVASILLSGALNR